MFLKIVLDVIIAMFLVNVFGFVYLTAPEGR